MREKFVASIRKHQPAFGLDLPEAAIERLAVYYEIIQEHNPILHLVAPCSAEEFATRHILESLTMLEFLPEGSRFADVGAGAGLPSIPCLLARDDLEGILIESKEKKAGFLAQAVSKLLRPGRADVIARQFEEVKGVDAQIVACRALDKFVDKLPRLLKWSGKRELLLFGGPSVIAALDQSGRVYRKKLMPLSERRYLLIVPSSF